VQPAISKEEAERTRKAFAAAGGNTTQAAKRLGIPRETMQSRVRKLGLKSSANPQQPKPQASTPTVPAAPAQTRVVLLTAAQDETGLLAGALPNLKAYAAHRGADIFLGGFTYQKGLFEDHAVRTGVFHHSIVPHLKPEVVELAPRLLWYGAANILPTAADPLSGWDTNTRAAWAIFPHAKIALKSVPVMPGRPGKQIMTTGVITKPNYVQRNAGQKAEFHHTPGAAVAEIKPDGTFFVRQLSMLSDGSFQDLDVLVRDGKVTTGAPVEAIVWGDVHVEVLDTGIAKLAWGYDRATGVCSGGSMLDTLKPRLQFIHDSFDFKARSHHTRNDPHERAKRLAEGCDSVEEMLRETARFLAATRRQRTVSVHVASNHNSHLEKWLKDPAGAFDARNARVWHRLNLAWHDAIDRGDEAFLGHVHALQNAGQDLGDVIFLAPGESFLVCQGRAPVECGLHGDTGPRGARGSPANLHKIVERVCCGHTHEPRIVEGAYYAGTCSRLDLDYAKRGPTAWHHAAVVIYPTGKRAIVTMQNGEWRA